MNMIDGLELNSRSYLLWNNDLGLVVAEDGADIQTPVASLTKMMTALVVLENRQLDEQVTIVPEMLSGLEEFAVIGLQVGQVLTVEELLYATMLPSAGDAAQALAIGTSGSIEEFAQLMNARANQIGMTQTNFSNPVGFDEDNYSTPRDIAKLLQEALKNPEFVKIFETYTQELPSIGKVAQKTFPEQTPYVKGGKTGYTEAAGRCLASTAEIEGTEYILVTIGAELGQNLVDAEKVYRMVEETYEPVQVVSAGEKIAQIGVSGSVTKQLEVVAERDVTVALENGVVAQDLVYDYAGATEIDAETETGVIGEYMIRQGEDVLYRQEVRYVERLEFYNYGWVALGVGISAALGIATLAALIQGWRKPKLKWLEKVLLIGLGLFVVSVVVNFLVFRAWFEPGGETTVLTLTGVESEPETEATPEETVDSEELEVGETNSEADVWAGVNCTIKNENLMLINPNFTVSEDFIAARRQGLVSISQLYGIPEYHYAGNGDNLMMPEAAMHLNEMVTAYRAENSGHEMGTYSCFRSRGTQCGRLCAATGASDHHTGLTCDLIDLAYGSVLDSDDYPAHLEWQWLKANSYKYGFIDRFPEAWAGGSMSEPLNVDEFGSTGLYETWHYRYVGVKAATEIATGKYNGGKYDSLEHYLKATGMVTDLKNGSCR